MTLNKSSGFKQAHSPNLVEIAKSSMTKNTQNRVFQSLLNGHCAEFTFLDKKKPASADAGIEASLMAFSEIEEICHEIPQSSQPSHQSSQSAPKDRVSTSPNHQLEKIRRGRS